MKDFHPEPDELAADLAGELSPEEEKRVQDHLVACRECSELLLDLAALGDPDYGADEPFTPADADAVWEGVRKRIGHEETVLPFRAPVRTSPPRWLAALAATLLVAVLGLSLWVASLRRAVEDLSRPQINAPVIDLQPGARRGEATATAEVPAAARLFTLVLLPERRGTYEDYEAEIAGADGATVWRERGLEPNAFGSFSLTLPRRTLGPGNYRVRLSGIGPGGRRELLGEYGLRL